MIRLQEGNKGGHKRLHGGVLPFLLRVALRAAPRPSRPSAVFSHLQRRRAGTTSPQGREEVGAVPSVLPWRASPGPAFYGARSFSRGSRLFPEGALSRSASEGRWCWTSFVGWAGPHPPVQAPVLAGVGRKEPAVLSAPEHHPGTKFQPLIDHVIG